MGNGYEIESIEVKNNVLVGETSTTGSSPIMLSNVKRADVIGNVIRGMGRPSYGALLLSFDIFWYKVSGYQVIFNYNFTNNIIDCNIPSDLENTQKHLAFIRQEGGTYQADTYFNITLANNVKMPFRENADIDFAFVVANNAILNMMNNIGIVAGNNVTSVPIDNTLLYDKTAYKMLHGTGFAVKDASGFTDAKHVGNTSEKPEARIAVYSGANNPVKGKSMYIGFTFHNTTDDKYYVISAIDANGTPTWVEEGTLTSNTIPSDVRRSGTTIQRNQLTAEYVYNNLYNGFDFYDTTLKWPFYAQVIRMGSGSEDDPYVYSLKWIPRTYHTKVVTINDIGFCYYDKQTYKPLYVAAVNETTGVAVWKDATGNNP
jgi:hypothetical protein